VKLLRKPAAVAVAALALTALSATTAQAHDGNHPAFHSAARSVLTISMAMVIGPTPPGTGVMRLAMPSSSAARTSPVRPSGCGGCRRRSRWRRA
jgi:hypothetical protein